MHLTPLSAPGRAARIIHGLLITTLIQPDPLAPLTLARLCGTIDHQESLGSVLLADGRHYHPPFDPAELHRAHLTFGDLGEAEATRRVDAEIRAHLGQLLGHGLTWQLWSAQVTASQHGVLYGLATQGGLQENHLDDALALLTDQAVLEAQLLGAAV